MIINDKDLIIKIAKKHYELGQSQENIAKEEGVSKSTINRIIKKACELGFVKIEVNYPLESVKNMEEKFKDIFDIENVFVCPAYLDDYLVRTNDTCKAVANDIVDLLRDDDIVGVSWGRTMDTVSSLLTSPATPKRNIKVVQMHGAVTKNIASSKFNTIIENFANIFLGTGYLLPAPIVVDTKEIADAIMSDSSIRTTFDIIEKSQIAVFGIGDVSTKSILVERGIYKEEQYEEMKNIEVVGDVCSRYFDLNGNPVLTELSDRTIGITTQEIKSKRHRLGVAVGEHKTKAIIGALNAKYMTNFYTDEITAKEVLAEYEKMGN